MVAPVAAALVTGCGSDGENTWGIDTAGPVMAPMEHETDGPDEDGLSPASSSKTPWEPGGGDGAAKAAPRSLRQTTRPSPMPTPGLV